MASQPLLDTNRICRAGSRSARFTPSELTLHWSGDHLLLWRPPEFAGVLVPGMEGPGVIWLRESLARARGEPPDAAPSPLYDPPLEAAVRRFQRERGLAVDGIVGEMTQLALSADASAPMQPRLVKEED